MFLRWTDYIISQIKILLGPPILWGGRSYVSVCHGTPSSSTSRCPCWHWWAAGRSSAEHTGTPGLFVKLCLYPQISFCLNWISLRPWPVGDIPTPSSKYSVTVLPSGRAFPASLFLPWGPCLPLLSWSLSLCQSWLPQCLPPAQDSLGVRALFSSSLSAYSILGIVSSTYEWLNKRVLIERAKGRKKTKNSLPKNLTNPAGSSLPEGGRIQESVYTAPWTSTTNNKVFEHLSFSVYANLAPHLQSCWNVLLRTIFIA